MDKKTLSITMGAMVTAIFGAFLLLNRQTGDLFQGIFLFLYPIPMVAYAAQYGLKKGAAVFASMAFISIFTGDFTTIFSAISQVLIGLIFGGCLHHKVDMTKTLFGVMILSALASVLDMIGYSIISGIDLNQDALEMQAMMMEVFEQMGTTVPETMLATDTLKQILIVSMIGVGLLQGFVVYELSLLILRRLRFPVQRPKAVLSYVPPKWTGYFALVAFMAYNRCMIVPFEQEIVQNLALTVGMFGYLYLMCFGVLAVTWFLKKHNPSLGKWGVLIGILGLLIMPIFELLAGFLYVVGRKRYE